MRLLVTDLVVRYNEDEAKISFLVPNSGDELNELKRFYEFGDVSKTKKAKLAKELGIALVAFLEATHKVTFITADARTSQESSGRAGRKASTNKDGPFSFYDAR